MHVLHVLGKLISFGKSFFCFCVLSYIELASNERSDFKARELKSVHIDAEGLFLKLVLHKNYLNRLNLYNQVCSNICHSIENNSYLGKRCGNQFTR